MDAIYLTGIRAYGYTGALPEEQVLGQWFEVSVTLWLDLSQPGQSDRLSDTLDYRFIVETVQQLVKTSRFALLERLASAIADAILYPPHTPAIPMHQVRISLTKPNPPIPDFSGEVTVELTRQGHG